MMAGKCQGTGFRPALTSSGAGRKPVQYFRRRHLVDAQVKRPLQEADVVVIGAGIGGVSVAAELAARAKAQGKPVPSVLILEKDQRGADRQGASFRNAGILGSDNFEYVYDPDAVDEIAERLYLDTPDARKAHASMMAALGSGVRRAEQLQKRSGKDLAISKGPAAELYWRKQDTKWYEAALEHGRQHGKSWRLAGHEQLRETHGLSHKTIAGVLMYPEAAVVNPATVVDTIFEQASANPSIQMRHGTAFLDAKQLSDGKDGWMLETSTGPIKAKTVVDAREAFAPYPFRQAVITQMHETDVPSQVKAAKGVSLVDEYLYTRKHGNDRYLVGTGMVSLKPGEKAPAAMASTALHAAASHRKLAPKAPFPMHRVWTGVFGANKDELPSVGELARNWYVIGGAHGSGMTLTPVMAADVAASISGQKDSRTFHPSLTPRRFYLAKLRNKLKKALGTDKDIEVEIVKGTAESSPSKGYFAISEEQLDHMNTDLLLSTNPKARNREAKRREKLTDQWVRQQAKLVINAQ
jgi:glycine/D-amino acid oxidase-like deaminating enzyme